MEAGSKDVSLLDSDDITRVLLGVDGDASLLGETRRPAGKLCQHFNRAILVGRRTLILNRARWRYDCVTVIPPTLLGLMGEDPLHNRRTDEDAIERARGPPRIARIISEKIQRQWRLKALRLPAKMVPVNPHVQSANELLSSLFCTIRGLGEQDQPGAGTPGRFAMDSAGNNQALFSWSWYG